MLAGAPSAVPTLLRPLSEYAAVVGEYAGEAAA
jgi:hypothetical protein